MEDSTQTTPKPPPTGFFILLLNQFIRVLVGALIQGKENHEHSTKPGAKHACPHTHQIVQNLAWAAPDLGLHCSHSW